MAHEFFQGAVCMSLRIAGDQDNQSIPYMMQFLTQAQVDNQLLLPSCLTAKQRAALHAWAEAHDLAHMSTGEGEHRQLCLGPAESHDQVITDPQTFKQTSLTPRPSCKLSAHSAGKIKSQAIFAISDSDPQHGNHLVTRQDDLVPPN